MPSLSSLQSSRERFQALLGQVPVAPEHVDARVIETVDVGDHWRRKVVILPESNDPIPAWLLVPEASVKFRPAVLCLHATTKGAGKDVPAGVSGPEPGSRPIESRSYALHLVRRGYVALAPDLLCDGERVSKGLEPYDTRDFYCRHPHASAAGQIVWDCMRAVDFLLSLDEVDPERVGVIGHSHGAHYGLFAAVFDERIRVGVSNGPVLYWSGKGDPHHWARDPDPPTMIHMPRTRPYYERGEMPCAFWKLLAPVAPRPWLCMDGEGDWNHPQVRETFAGLREVYAGLGRQSNLAWFSYPGGHDFPDAARAHAYAWLDRVLQTARTSGAAAPRSLP